ncbi:unnamed protein product [Phytophthora fragariaefolia]|uniref:Unnamed protein product n=1 Tax=Phytophthora fragariaefolia TaxID=1490495 RepID=A0A9W6YC34_9STRA|nr:unnamed protein product [Phytophthora fragariaefolia]
MGIDVSAADWLRSQAGALRYHAGPNDVQEEVSQGLAIISLAMEDLQLPLVRSAKDAFDAWSRLEGHFEKKSLANKLFLRRRFFTTMMAEGDGVLEYINKIKTLAEQLDAVGAPVSADDLVITYLASLNESYQFLITALESRADSLTWELVTARPQHEDLKRKGRVLVTTVVNKDIGLPSVP